MDYRRNKIIQIISQEQEEDDELFFLLVPALYACLYEEKHLVHTSSLSRATKVKDILEGHVSWSRVEFRMEPEIFKSITDYLRRENLLKGTSRVAVEEQLAMFMYMISHNASNQDLQKYFQHSAETIHRKINNIFGLIPTLAQRFIKIPNSLQPHPKIVSNTHYWPYFQNCIGAIDGTHIPITIAEDKAPHLGIGKEPSHKMSWLQVILI
uniref:DUF8040 domain-containing protein n=1 Tax=Triticum urartu TaxID=4572 RepID=A0A8R7TKV1_TRIUA